MYNLHGHAQHTSQQALTTVRILAAKQICQSNKCTFAIIWRPSQLPPLCHCKRQANDNGKAHQDKQEDQALHTKPIVWQSDIMKHYQVDSCCHQRCNFVSSVFYKRNRVRMKRVSNEGMIKGLLNLHSINNKCIVHNKQVKA